MQMQLNYFLIVVGLMFGKVYKDAMIDDIALGVIQWLQVGESRFYLILWPDILCLGEDLPLGEQL